MKVIVKEYCLGFTLENKIENDSSIFNKPNKKELELDAM
jgi:hypothetical protein